MKKRKILSFILIFALVVALAPLTGSPISVSAEVPTGDWITNGEPTAPDQTVNNGATTATAIRISTESELAWLAQEVNGGNDFNNKHIRLTADLDLSGHYWVPIGIDYDNPFGGTFYGDDHTISGLNIYGTYQHAGLFGMLYYSGNSMTHLYVENLHIGENSSVQNNMGGSGGTGGITGAMMWGRISGCSNAGSINASNSAFGGIGGIVGYADSYSIDNCWNAGNVMGDNAQAGGIVGYANGASFTTSSINNCFNTGNIVSDCSDPTCYLVIAGGIVGLLDYRSIQNCYNTGDITSTNTFSGSSAEAGGIAGHQVGDDRISYCYSIGSVTAEGDDAYAGGISGTNVDLVPIVQNSVALNEKVVNRSAATAACRIGYQGDRSDNYALKTMVVTLDGTNETITSDPNGEDGADLEADSLKGSWWSDGSKWSAAAWDTDVWTLPEADEYGLPILKNVGGAQSSELPGYIGTAPDMTGGKDGSTSEAAIEITSASELVWVAQQTNSGTNFSGKYLKLMYNIDLSGRAWIPIGLDYDHAFKGTLLGNDKTISGLSVDGGYNYAGLFGCINSGAIYNLHIAADCSVGSSLASSFTGSIVGGTWSSTITGCSNAGAVEAGPNGCGGGIVGCQDAGQIQVCWNEGTITGTDSYIGGIAGYSGGSNCMIQQCYNSGSLDNGYSNGEGMAGGIVGYHDNHGTVQNCYNTGFIEIAGGSGGECYAGGIAGGQASYIIVKTEYCYNTGTVSGNGSGTCTGGIAGKNELAGLPVLRYCAALNESVSAGSTACRIGAGTNMRFNYALQIMNVKINGVDKTITEDKDNEDGANLNAGNLTGSWWSDGNWSATGTAWNSGIWTFPDADVPGVPILKNVGGAQTTAIPGFTASAVPEVSIAANAKTSVSQAAISFALTNNPAYANGQTWKVYDALTDGSLVSGVSASNVGNTLTLTHATDIPVGTYYVSITETGKAESARLALTVGSPQPPSITTASLPGGVVGSAYSQQLSASGGSPITWSLTAGTLPAGLTLSGITISGTPSTAGTYSFTIRAVNAIGSDTQDLSITIAAAGSGSGGGEGGGPASEPSKPVTSENTTTVTTTTTATMDGSGKASATVTKDQLNAAVKSAAAEAKKQGEGTSAVVEIKVDAPANSNTVETGIPKDALGLVANGGMDALTISTPVASISFDADALTKIYGEASADVKISTAKVDSSTLTEDTKQLVGDRPVFNFSVTSGNNTIAQFGGNVSVTVPYTPKAGEDTDAIVIYYINSEGKPEAVGNCKYDPVTETVSFATDHFSQYAVGYNKVSFSDVKDGVWYGNAVEFAAARGIVTGTGNGNFDPSGKLTRGQLLVMLMRAYGIEPDTNSADNFSDAGNKYYTGYLAAAKRLGITEGTGNNLYAPDKQITRQEMFTLLHNTLKVIGQLPEGTEKAGESLAGYSDADSVASWAKDAAGVLAKAGVIGGSNGKLLPKNTTSRAEMAQVLYNLLSK